MPGRFTEFDNTLCYRKSSQDEEVVTLAKTLIKAWKKFLPDNTGSASSGSSEKDKKVKSFIGCRNSWICMQYVHYTSPRPYVTSQFQFRKRKNTMAMVRLVMENMEIKRRKTVGQMARIKLFLRGDRRHRMM